MSDSYDDYESNTLTGRYMRANEPSWMGPCFTCGTRLGVKLYRGGGRYCNEHAPVTTAASPDPNTDTTGGENAPVTKG